MTAPTRIVYGERNTYRLDPYVRDVAGRFAPKPATEPAPLAVLIESGVVQYLHGGALIIEQNPDSRNRWTVRVVREDDGSHRVVYLQGG